MCYTGFNIAWYADGRNIIISTVFSTRMQNIPHRRKCVPFVVLVVWKTILFYLPKGNYSVAKWFIQLLQPWATIRCEPVCFCFYIASCSLYAISWFHILSSDIAIFLVQVWPDCLDFHNKAYVPLYESSTLIYPSFQILDLLLMLYTVNRIFKIWHGNHDNR